MCLSHQFHPPHFVQKLLVVGLGEGLHLTVLCSIFSKFLPPHFPPSLEPHIIPFLFSYVMLFLTRENQIKYVFVIKHPPALLLKNSSPHSVY